MDPDQLAAYQAYVAAILKKVLDVKEQIKYVAVYAACAMLVLGIVGNVIALILFLKKSLKNTSSGVYFTAIITLDLLFIILGAVPDLAFISIEENMGDKVGGWLCKCWTFLFRTVQGLSTWVLLAAAVDTFLLVQKPENASVRNTVPKARAAIAALSLVTIVLDLWVFWGIDARGDIEPLRQNTITGTVQITQCAYSSVKFLTFDVNDNQYIFLALYSILPSFGLIVLFIPVLLRVLRMHMVMVEPVIQRRARMSGALILCSSVTFVLMEAPNIAMGALFWSEVVEPYAADPVGMVWRLFVKGVLIFFGYAHHSLKFYLYLAVSPRFRKDFTNICKSQIHYMRNSINSTETNVNNKVDCEKRDGESLTIQKNAAEAMAKY